MSSERRKEIERWLTESELDDRLATVDGELLRRLIFIKNLYCGDTVATAADRVGRSESTGDRWASAWNEGGPEALTPEYGGGRPPKLDGGDREQLQTLLQEGQPWRSREIRQLLDDQFDVAFHTNYLPAFLQELGLTYAPVTQEPSEEYTEANHSGGWVFE